MQGSNTKVAIWVGAFWLLGGCGKTVTLNQPAHGSGGSGDTAGADDSAGSAQGGDAGAGGEPSPTGGGAQAGASNHVGGASGGTNAGASNGGSAENAGAPTCTPAGGGAGSAGAGTSNCLIKNGADACTSIPKFSGAQVVDGFGDDLCDVPATTFELKKGNSISGALPNLPETLKARIAWDEKGIHAHLHVDDPLLIASYRMDSWGPDYVELDVGGNEPFSGLFDGKTADKGFSDLLFTPAGSVTAIPNFATSGPANALMRFNSGPAGMGPMPMPREIPWASRLVSGGYEFELFIPWNVLGRDTPPQSGDTVALDLGLGTSDDPNYWSWWPAQASQPGAPGLNAVSWYKLNALPQGTKSTCASPLIFPWCDDRTWCSPTLE